jgi:hypothetical protein
MKSNIRTYQYINALNRNKTLVVYLDSINENGIYNEIWDDDTGEFCSSNYNTKETIINFLAKKGIQTDLA